MSILKARSAPRTIIGLLAALGLVATLAMPAFAGAPETVWATVDGYAEGSAGNNDASAWGTDCTKLPTPAGGWDATYVLPELGEGLIYRLVVVKAGSDQSTEAGANTLFEFPAAGETVWSDAAADGVFGEGDKNISHVIVCTSEEEDEPTPTPTPADEEPTPTPADEEPTPTPADEEPTPTPTINEGELGGNPTPTGEPLPDTALGQFGQVPATVLSLVLMAALAATIYVRLARQR